MPAPTVVEGLPQAAEGTQSYGNRFFFTTVLASPTAIAAPATSSQSTEQSLTVTGLLASDMVVSINKPTMQATLGLLNGRVSAASTLKLSFYSGSTSITPTAAEIYLLLVYRQAT